MTDNLGAVAALPVVTVLYPPDSVAPLTIVCVFMPSAATGTGGKAGLLVVACL
jgi:hypothetical protein